MQVKECGSKNSTSIMFIHGGGVSGWMWDKQMKFFSDYHLLVPDLPGHGDSNDEPFVSIEDCAAKLVEIIHDRCNSQKVVIVGFSLGAQIALSMLSIEPKLATHAIINSALVRPMPLVSALVQPTVWLSLPLTKSRSFAKLQARELYIGPEYFEQYFADSSTTSGPNLSAVLRSNMSFSIPSGFAMAETKSLCLIGAKERNVMKLSAQDIVAANPHSALVSVPAIGHGISLADPALFNKIVSAWINNEEVEVN
ncbi:MAG: hypothetical protein FD169_1698 [Bacillota bacterium]|nr:MAG: hypothetical protein FD169_1698 [Bacillota bacterium]